MRYVVFYKDLQSLSHRHYVGGRRGSTNAQSTGFLVLTFKVFTEYGPALIFANDVQSVVLVEATDPASEPQTPDPEGRELAMNELNEILDSYANFKVWESQQEWKPDYDREANIANSRNRAHKAIQRLILEAQKTELESAHVNWYTEDKRWLEYYPTRADILEKEMEGLK